MHRNLDSRSWQAQFNNGYGSLPVLTLALSPQWEQRAKSSAQQLSEAQLVAAALELSGSLLALFGMRALGVARHPGESRCPFWLVPCLSPNRTNSMSPGSML